MRGKVHKTQPYDLCSRITPAYAGKREAQHATVGVSWDHPRLCGEKPFLADSFTVSHGSPPPMRGKGKEAANSGNYNRITPAYAGKSNTLCFCHCVNTGSPPPMRGKAFWGINAVICQGITPAYAGKSMGADERISFRQDHPRLCGEKDTRVTGKRSNRGSPPPMRGKGEDSSGNYFGTGITPAYAGKSASTRSTGRCMQDHPRLCGEKAKRRNGEKS